VKLLVDMREAGEALSVSRTTLYDLIRRGELRPLRVGRAVRFERAALEDYVARLRGEAQTGEGDGR
jgi:excisionase family DNA binding protein